MPIAQAAELPREAVVFTTFDQQARSHIEAALIKCLSRSEATGRVRSGGLGCPMDARTVA
jgi:hypothetical protein